MFEQISVPNWPSTIPGLASEVKLRTRVTLKKRDCISAVTRIRENNNVLRRLVAHSAAFESTRRANSQAKIAKEVRTTAQGLFSSLRKVIRCECMDSHTVGLHVGQKTGEDGDFKEAGVSFELLFGTTNNHHNYTPRFELLNIHWKEEKAESPRQSSAMAASQSIASLSLEDGRNSTRKIRFLGASLGQAFSKLRRSPSPSKLERRGKVRFSETVTTISRDEARIEIVGDGSMVTGIALPHITDLCADIKRGEAMASQSVGYIPCAETPTPGSFNLYRHDFLRKLSKAGLTLQDALSGKKAGLVEFELTERLNIALALSFGVLQLCNTQWLGKVISLEGIVFLRAANGDQCYSQSLDNPSLFLVCQPSRDTRSEKPAKPINLALLSLGVILTHIIMGRPVEAIDISEDMTKEALLSRRDLVFNKVEICDYASTNYVDAVQWCLQNCFTFNTLEDESLSRDFHDAVISRLESDLRSIHGLNIQ